MVSSIGNQGHRELHQFRTFVQYCESCHAVTPSHEWTYEDLLGLYRDYRLKSYNSERIAVEPSYAAIASLVGSHPEEIRIRNLAVDRFIGASGVEISGERVIDYGGGDGRFLPAIVLDRYRSIEIFDASDAPIHGSVDVARVRRTGMPQLDAYDLLMCMHVLEHVGNPRAFVVEALRYLRPGGLLYIEVPLELTPERRDLFRTRVMDVPIAIHEHINSYDRTTVSTMIRSIEDLECVAEEDGMADLGWTNVTIGRYLARKRG
jgi:SAM-dependent methyltransferase